MRVDVFCCTAPGSAPINVRARAVSSSTVVAQWDEPLVPNGFVKVSQYSLLTARARAPRCFIASRFMTIAECPADETGQDVDRPHALLRHCRIVIDFVVPL